MFIRRSAVIKTPFKGDFSSSEGSRLLACDNFRDLNLLGATEKGGICDVKTPNCSPPANCLYSVTICALCLISQELSKSPSPAASLYFLRGIDMYS